jgi:hypothetical protein
MAASIAAGCITPSADPEACIPQFHDHALPVMSTILGLLQGARREQQKPLWRPYRWKPKCCSLEWYFSEHLVVSRFPIKIGIPSILGVLALGLMINIHVLDVGHSEVETLHVSALAPPIRARR